MNGVADHGRLVGGEEFRLHMEPLASSLEAWAAAWARQPEHHGYLPSVGSRAMAELAGERRWSTSGWLEPARNAHSYGSMLAYVLAEHVSAFASILRSRVGPAFSHLPTVRAVMEAVPVAHWLMESDVPLETRIKRSIVYRLNSADQAGRMRHLPEFDTRSAATRQACLAFAAHHGWSLRARSLDGEVLPTASDAFSRVAFGHAPSGLDQTLWNLASAAQHGTWYVFADGMRDRLIPGGALDPTGGMAPIIVKGENLTMMGVMCWLGCARVAAERCELMGWSPSPDMIEPAKQLQAIAQAVGERSSGVR